MFLVNQLTGFGAGGGALTTLALQGSATLSTAASITAPSDINAGDLLLFLDRTFGTETSVIPSGFTELVADTGLKLYLSFKVASGAEQSTTIGGMSGSAHSKIMACFRGNRPITAAMGASPLSEQSSGNPTGFAVTAGAGTPPLLVVAAYSVNPAGAVDPRTFSTTKDAETASADSSLYLAWKFYASSPANTTIDMDDEGTNNTLLGAYLTLSS